MNFVVDSKKPTGVGLLACGEQDLTARRDGGIVELRTERWVYFSTFSKSINVHFNIHTSYGRRSFYAVGQSCDTNLIPPETRNYGHCEVSPTSEGGINSVNVTNCRIRQGAVLPAGTKWLLITGLMERVLGRGSRTALIRRTVGN